MNSVPTANGEVLSNFRQRSGHNQQSFSISFFQLFILFTTYFGDHCTLFKSHLGLVKLAQKLIAWFDVFNKQS
jgi:hypothetical protein